MENIWTQIRNARHAVADAQNVMDLILVEAAIRICMYIMATV
jgi:hypothetical protein